MKKIIPNILLITAVLFCAAVSGSAAGTLSRHPVSAGSINTPPSAAMIRAMHDHLVFPMEIVRHQQELNLNSDQKDYIKERIQEAESELAGLNWDLQEAVAKLNSLLKQNTVDEKQSLTLLEQILDLENSIKKNRFLLMVLIKNKLTPEQTEQLKSIKRERSYNRKVPNYNAPGHNSRKPGSADIKSPEPKQQNQLREP